MYTFDMYRLNAASRPWLLEQVREKIKHPIPPPTLHGFTPDLASQRSLFFVAENSEQITARIPALRAFAQNHHQVVLAVPELLRSPALEAWDFLPAEEKQHIRILLIPQPPSHTPAGAKQ